MRRLAALLAGWVFAANGLWAQTPLLRGEVMLVDENGVASPAARVEVTVKETGGSDIADGKGLFRIALPKGFQPGREITVSADKQGWAIWQPIEGKTAIPAGLLTIRLLPKGSKKFWTDKFIQTFIEDTAEKAKLQVRLANQQEPQKPVDFGPMIKEWALKYGFTPEDAKEQIDKWVAEVQATQQDFYKLGLAAFAQHNFHKAGELFNEAGRNSEKQLAAVSRQEAELGARRAQLTEETVRNYRQAGDARYSDYAFAEALAAYQKALGFVERGRQPALWAAVQIEIGVAADEIGLRAEGVAVHKYLVQAAAAHRAALEVYTREQLPKDWAMTQNNLGVILQEQGTRTGGEEGRQLLAQAVTAYRAALEVRTREQLPQQWATTQNNLGIVLKEQGTRTGGEEGRQLLAQAVAAYRAALEVYTREQLSQDWAMTQNNLGVVLQEQGTRTGGEEGRQLLAQAVTAYRAALEVYTREQLPQRWAGTQNNLGAILQEQGTRTGGEEGRQLLAQAVAAYRAALEVQTREQLPQDWAATQNNLGTVLQEQGTRTGGEEGRPLLVEATTAYRAALEVYTPEQLPQQWVTTQNNLAKAYFDLGQSADAVQSLRNVLGIYPESQETYSRLGDLYHERMFDFHSAFDLHEDWLGRHPDDLSARENAAEAALTVGRFVDAKTRLAQILRSAGLPAGLQAALRALEIVALLAERKTETVPQKLEELRDLVSSQSEDFRVGWTWAGTVHFIQTDERLAPVRGWLLSFLDVIQRKDRAAILEGLRTIGSPPK